MKDKTICHRCKNKIEDYSKLCFFKGRKVCVTCYCELRYKGSPFQIQLCIKKSEKQLAKRIKEIKNKELQVVKKVCSRCNEKISNSEEWQYDLTNNPICEKCISRGGFSNPQEKKPELKKVEEIKSPIVEKKEKKKKVLLQPKNNQESRLIKSQKIKTFPNLRVRPRIRLYKKICQYHLCKIEFETSNPRILYHTDACRLLASYYDKCKCGNLKSKKAKYCRECYDKFPPKPRDIQSGKFLKTKDIKIKVTF